ncbi:MAG: 50S ribosomal protein L11 methyltransferase [Bacteroides sp.]|nr:50S ribosomal protein L11 methyltransferase [Bacteroides sp.]
MNNYFEVKLTFDPCSEVVTDVAAALLANAGFETFVPDENGLTAYVASSIYTPALIDQALDAFPVPEVKYSYTVTEIEGQDWNSEWEKNYFKPIVIGNRCVIHSSFHKNVPTCEYDIVIDPKMAFGTGHHSTTTLILERLLKMDLTDKNVIDMGTGTGILSILAAMRGASQVTGIEIDDPAWENAVENCKLNGMDNITMIHGDAGVLEQIPYKANVFLANINRNVIVADLPNYCKVLAPDARMFLSGFYESDIPVILAAAEPLGLEFVNHTTLNDWACVCLKHS